MSGSVTLTASAGLLHLPLSIPLEHGGVLEAGRLAFELEGPDDGPVVLVLGGISAGRHVASTRSDPAPGWWRGVVGPGGPVDTDRFRVLGVDYLGGVGGSSGPEIDRRSVARIGTRDQARALALLCEHLGIDILHAVVGASYGGMVGLAFAEELGARTGRLVAISAPAQSHPLATAWRGLQRRLVRTGLAHGCAREALSIARGFAMTSYRSAASIAERTDVDGWLRARGAAFVEQIAPERFLCLSESLDLHAVDPSRIAVPTTVVGCRSDALVPFGQLQELAAALAGPSRLCEVDSIHGHDAFLKETDAVGAIVRGALDGAAFGPGELVCSVFDQEVSR